MFIIERNILNVKRYLIGFHCEDSSDLKNLEKNCKELNELSEKEGDKATYEIIELKDQFICEVCEEIYFNKHLNKKECNCGALRCEYCEDLGECTCDFTDDYNELRDVCIHDNY
jgi:hypothetical protein